MGEGAEGLLVVLLESVAPLEACRVSGGLPRARERIMPRLVCGTSVHREPDLRSQERLRRAVPTVAHNRRRGFGSDQVDIAAERVGAIVRYIPIAIIPYSLTKLFVSDSLSDVRGAVLVAAVMDKNS
jgi:hypothetical protein